MQRACSANSFLFFTGACEKESSGGVVLVMRAAGHKGL
jgi:hypothetical protein